MSEPSREDLIRKIALLIAKAEGTDNEHEKAIFIAKAEEMLQEHNLEMREVLSTNVDESLISEQVVRWEQKNRVAWKLELASIIAHNFFCGYLITGRGPLFYGRKRNLDVTVQIYSALVLQIEALAAKRTHEYGEEFRKKYGESARWEYGAYHPKAWRNSWMAGCLDGFRNVLYQQKRQFEQSSEKSRALMVLTQKELTEHLQKTRPKIGYYEFHVNSSDSRAYSQGYEDGSNLRPNRGELKDSVG